MVCGWCPNLLISMYIPPKNTTQLTKTNDIHTYHGSHRPPPQRLHVDVQAPYYTQSLVCTPSTLGVIIILFQQQTLQHQPSICASWFDAQSNSHQQYDRGRMEERGQQPWRMVAEYIIKLTVIAWGVGLAPGCLGLGIMVSTLSHHCSFAHLPLTTSSHHSHHQHPWQ